MSPGGFLVCLAPSIRPSGGPIAQIGWSRVGHHGEVERTAARRYVARLIVLHGAIVLFLLGLLLAILGARLFGGVSMLVGFLAWPVGVLSAWLPAVRRRDGKPWFGPGSVTEDANDRMGWGDLAPASIALGREPALLRGGLLALTLLAVGLTLVVAVIVVVGSLVSGT